MNICGDYAFWVQYDFVMDPLSLLAAITAAQNPQHLNVSATESCDVPGSDKRHQKKGKSSDGPQDDPVTELHQLARDNSKNIALYRAVAARISAKKGEWPFRDLARALNSYTVGVTNEYKAGGAITATDTNFCQYVASQFRAREEQLAQLTASELIQCISAFDRLGFRDSALWGSFGRQILKKSKHLEHGHWSIAVRAFTRQGLPLQGDCQPRKRPKYTRDWERPPPPKKPKPISDC